MSYDVGSDGEPPVIPDEDSAEYNLNQKCECILEQTQQDADKFRSKKNFMMILGNDFSHVNAHYNFWALDKVIDYCNERFGKSFNMKMTYSTPSTYIRAI